MMAFSPSSASGARISKILAIFLFVGVFFALSSSLTANAQEEEDWQPVVTKMEEYLEGIPAEYASGDSKAVQHSIRKAYYDIYQVSGLEDQIRHRLGRDRQEDFVAVLLNVRTLSNEGAPQDEVAQAVKTAIDHLNKDVAELATTKTISDQWTRVAQAIVENIDTSVKEYGAGDVDKGYKHATAAYLQHYEAEGLEKATISYIGQGRVSEVENGFRDLRQGIRGGLAHDEVVKIAENLKSMVNEDATELDKLAGSNEGLGWKGFFASFLILLREGAEALLVVAAVITYAMKAKRKDQVAGIIVGVVAAIVLSVMIAIVLARLTSNVSGLAQELIEGFTGIAAVLMLIYVSNWIFSKSHGAKWNEYMQSVAGSKTQSGGVFGLALVAFLAVLREGAETILFFSPILTAARSGSDYAFIWLGVGVALVILIILFLLVWVFGVRLPIRKFFRWTSLLLGMLAVTIAGGAAKEFQDATWLHTTDVPGVPEIAVLGLYPTVQTLVAQAIVVVILIILAVVQYRISKNTKRESCASAANNEQRAVKDTTSV